MTRIAIACLAGLTLLAAPAAAQNQGSVGSSGQLPSSMPQGFPGDRPEAGNMGALEHNQATEKFAFDRSGSGQGSKFETQAAAFVAESADRREEAMALGRMAQSGEPIDMDPGDIRAALEQDLKEWRTTFDIPRRHFRSIHDQLVPREEDLTSAEWAVRRAQWFQARDQWIDDQLDSGG